MLKVQHHGSEHNIDADFCRRVTADHYVFCGNGDHDNPDLTRCEAILDSRLGSDAERATNPDADGKFRLWFNSSSGITEGDKAHMERVESRVRERAGRSGELMTHFFLRGSSFLVEI